MGDIPWVEAPAILAPNGEKQYELVDASKKELLELAAAIGPLFGSHSRGVRESGKHEVRESIACWISASGVLGCAQKIRSCLDEGNDPCVLDDEILAEYASSPSARVLRINYLNTDGFHDEYLHMLLVGDEEYESTFPLEEEKATSARAGFDASTILTMKFDDSTGAFAPVNSDARIPASEAALDEVGARTSSTREYALYDKSDRLIARLGPDQAVAYAWVATGNPDALDELNDMVLYKERPLPDDFESTWTLSNAGLVSFPRECRVLYEHLYDNLILLHTHRTTYDLRYGRKGTPRYTSALEHIWMSFAASGIKYPVKFCKNCGKPFISRHGREWCDDLCRQQGYPVIRRRRSLRVRVALQLVDPDEPFTAKEVLEIIGIANYKDEVLKTLLSLTKHGVLKSLGGNGLGKRYRFTERGKLESPGYLGESGYEVWQLHL